MFRRSSCIFFQAQSMAHLNYPIPCCQGPWMNQCGYEDRGSNLSLNMGPGGYPMNPMWMGTWHGPPPTSVPYPYPVAIPHMHHDARSCTHSRPPSPTHSVKSRKSTLSRKSRKKYRDVEDTDDEEDRRSNFSHTDRSERKSLGSRYTPRERSLRESLPRDLPRRNTVDKVERGSVARSRHSIRGSSSESDDEQSEELIESQKESDIINEEDETEYDNTANTIVEVPDASWECEHCTFVNEPGTRVCQICCKTPSANVKIFKKETSQKKVLEVPKKIPTNSNSKSRDKLQRTLSSDDYSKDYSETESLLNKLGKLNVREPEEKPAPLEVKKGRTPRKISFWPGTKFTPFQKNK